MSMTVIANRANTLDIREPISIIRLLLKREYHKDVKLRNEFSLMNFPHFPATTCNNNIIITLGTYLDVFDLRNKVTR